MAAVISGALMAEKRARKTCCPGTRAIHFTVFSITYKSSHVLFMRFKRSEGHDRQPGVKTTSFQHERHGIHHSVSVTSKQMFSPSRSQSSHRTRWVQPLASCCRCLHTCACHVQGM